MMGKSARRDDFVLTGRHVLATVLLFFATVFAVNFYMARVAIATFSGLEAAKPYQEGLRYDSVIAAARAQAERGWRVDAQVRRAGEAARIAVTQADSAGAPTPGLELNATFLHPADRRRDVKVRLAKVDAGRYAADLALQPGIWDLRIEAARGDEILFRSVNRIEFR